MTEGLCSQRYLGQDEAGLFGAKPINEEAWNRRAPLRHRQGGTVDSIALLSPSDICIFCDKPSKAASERYHDVPHCRALLKRRLVSVDEHGIPGAGAQHLHGIIVLRADKKRQCCPSTACSSTCWSRSRGRRQWMSNHRRQSPSCLRDRRSH